MKTVTKLGILALTLCVLLTGCSRKENQTDDTISDEATTESVEAADTPTTAEEEEYEEPEEPSTEVVIDESIYKLAFISVTSMVGENEDAFSDLIRNEYQNGECITDWTGRTIWAYSFVLELTDPEASCYSPDIYHRSTGEDLSNIPGKSSVNTYTNCNVYDIEDEYEYLYDVEREIYPFIFYIDEEIPLEELDIRVHISPKEDIWGDASLSINASIDDLSVNYSMASRPLIKYGDSIYLAWQESIGGGVGPGGVGDATWYTYEFKNLSNPFSTDGFDMNAIEDLHYVDRETLKEIEPINGCSPFWDEYTAYYRMGFYSDTKLPDWSTEEKPLFTTYPKVTINGEPIIIIY